MGSQSSHQTTKTPLVSVIIPAYNAAGNITKLLHNILSQTYNHLEVIVINDGSTDQTSNLVAEIAKTDTRVILLDQSNQGVSSARNHGLELTNGEYIIFVDADDSIRPDMISVMLRSATEHPDSLIVCGKKIGNYKILLPAFAGLVKDKLKSHILRSILKNGLLYSPCNKIYRAAIIKQHQIHFPKKVNYGEDLIFNLDYMKHIDSIFYIREPLYLYRLSNTGLSSHSSEEFKDRTIMYRKLKQFMGPKIYFVDRFVLIAVNIRWKISVIKAKIKSHGQSR